MSRRAARFQLLSEVTNFRLPITIDFKAEIRNMLLLPYKSSANPTHSALKLVCDQMTAGMGMSYRLGTSGYLTMCYKLSINRIKSVT